MSAIAILEPCKIHPRYKAIKRATSGCKRCLQIWEIREAERKSKEKIDRVLDEIEKNPSLLDE